MRIPSNKIKDIVQFFRNELKDHYENNEIELFIAYCFEDIAGIKRNDLRLNDNKTVNESDLLKLNFAVKDLKKQKPIQYILGKADFYGLKFIVNEHVLIPRPETEELVHLIIQDIKLPNSNSPVSILDIGTGSGCIPITLKKNIPLADIYALDISEKALEVARQNAEMNNVKISFINHDILLSPSPLERIGARSFDIIVSNPPYVLHSEKGQMEKNVLNYEPHLALFVEDQDPLLFYKSIADFALKHLNSKGKLYFEINQAFGSEAMQLLERKRFKNVTLVKDLSNKNRILRGNV